MLHISYSSIGLHSRKESWWPRWKESRRQREEKGDPSALSHIRVYVVHVEYFLSWLFVVSSYISEYKSLFLCDAAEGIIWLGLRLGIGIREESSGQRLRGREASTSSVRLWIPVRLKVWFRLRSASSEGPTATQERCVFRLRSDEPVST